ncbi:unnamed protein product [Sphenostylis stenocarpa]|uniref:Uncharacterized protein n=1 Tax=Sphenostylis stenocarpa TaxID=92480 RepID=A0AA86SLS2_9FABA|nr:unnamed protein product [Sphenostylis stenocarpa]
MCWERERGFQIMVTTDHHVSTCVKGNGSEVGARKRHERELKFRDVRLHFTKLLIAYLKQRLKPGQAQFIVNSV